MKEIISKDNSLLKYVSKLEREAKFRRQEGRFVAEGLRVCLEAVLSNAQVEYVFVSEDALLKHGEQLKPLLGLECEIYKLSGRAMSAICDTKTPQGVLCVLKTLDIDIDFDTMYNKYIYNRYILLENIQDPSNLGTILRTADALGVSGVIMTEDCCDIYSPKVCRGSMGALYRIPFSIITDAPSFIRKFKEHGCAYAAVVRDGDKLGSFNFSESSLIVIGNEGNGLTGETIAECDRQVTIPMSGNAESLNASIASAILMWEMMK